MTRKYTASKCVEDESGRGFVAGEKITCEVVGEMDTGTKVWEDVETGEQYFLFRLFGKNYFCKQ